MSGIVALVVVVAAYGECLRYSFFGHDGFSMIAAARITDAGEFVGTFTEEFLDGEFFLSYYRPVLNLSVALDWALWGLNPFGYQLSQLLGFAACALGLLLLLRRGLGAGESPGAPGTVAPRWPGWVALTTVLAFALYPSHGEVIPVLERRHDPLCLAFLAFGLAAHLAPGALDSPRPRLRTGVLAFLALGTKEVGALAIPLNLTAVFLFSRRTGAVARGKHALLRCTPELVAGGLLVAARFVVLGSVGEGGEQGPLVDPRRMRLFWQRLLFPQADQFDTSLAEVGRFLVPLGMVAVALFALVRNRARADAAVRRALGLAGLGLLWMALIAVVMSYRNKAMMPWHFVLGAGAWSLCVAGVAALVPAVWRGAGALRRIGLLAGLAPLVLVTGWGVSRSYLFHAYDAWDGANAQGIAFRAEVDRLVEGALPGDVVLAPPVPIRGAGGPPDERVRYPGLMAARTVASYVALRHPGRRVIVTGPFGRDAKPVEDVVLVLNESSLSRAGPTGALNELTVALARESADAKKRVGDMGRILEAGNVALARALLFDLVADFPGPDAGRYLALAEYFTWIHDRPTADRALGEAEERFPNDPELARWRAGERP